MGNDVDVVGCDDGDNGRSCASHIVCGTHLHTGDVIIFRWAVIPINDEAEEVIKTFIVVFQTITIKNLERGNKLISWD